MKKILDYDIVSSNSKSDLVKRVKEALSNGWELHGNTNSEITSVSKHINQGQEINTVCYYQPVVKFKISKYEEDDRGEIGPG